MLEQRPSSLGNSPDKLFLDTSNLLKDFTLPIFGGIDPTKWFRANSVTLTNTLC